MCPSEERKPSSSHRDTCRCFRCLLQRQTSRWMFPVVGLVALIWFCIRVIPRPSRARYPCQRIAFPLASGFVIWLLGALGSVAVLRRARRHFAHSRYLLASLLVAVAVAAMSLTVTVTDSAQLMAAPTPNSPIGTARGLRPGRVVWVRDPAVTDWAGPGSGTLPQDAVEQSVVDTMLEKAVLAYTGEDTLAGAWDAVIRHFNQQQGKGNIGYTAGEKICIKTNFNIVNSRDKSDPSWWYYCCTIPCAECVDSSPQVAVALLKQLVDVVGVSPSDITIGDPSRMVPDYWYSTVHGTGGLEDVQILDRNAGAPNYRQSQWSSVEFHWSDPDPDHFVGVTETDHVPLSIAESDYFINFPILTSHEHAGVTICAKNHYGSMLRNPDASDQSDPGEWYDMHLTRALEVPQEGDYRCMVDLLGHEELGGKTLLCVTDGIFGASNWTHHPFQWDMYPFDTDWVSSVLVSQDPIAMDSVCFDFLYEEQDDGGSFPYDYPHMSGADDYMHEAAQADSPVSGAVYDPEADSVVMDSLGTHEHWDNATYKRYTRNLGTGDGVELIGLMLESDGKPTNPSPSDGATNVSTDHDLGWSAATEEESYDVYVGTSLSAVTCADTSDPEYQGNTASTSYEPGTLATSTTYYWRVDGVKGAHIWPGDVWSFTTEPPDWGSLVWGLNGPGGIFVRTGIDGANPAGIGWSRAPGKLAQVSAGEAALWGVNSAGGIFVREGIAPGSPAGTGWTRCPGKLAQVAVGAEGIVWGLNDAGGIFVRTGIDSAHPTGTGWTRVPGRLDILSVGSYSAWGLNENGGIFCRLGVSPANPSGTAWEQVPGRLTHVSVGLTGVVWGINENGGIFYREGTDLSDPAGTGWGRVPGKLEQVSLGSGCAWGVNSTGGVWFRVPVCPNEPAGLAWQQIAGRLSQVTVGTVEPLEADQMQSTADAEGSQTAWDTETSYEPTEGTDEGADDQGTLAATGSGDAEGTEGGAEDLSAPTVEITSVSESAEAAVLRVEGTATDAGAVDAIWVNGVLATATSTGYATWQAGVPVSEGWTADDPAAGVELVVCAVDAAGNYAPEADTETVLSVGRCGLVRVSGRSAKVKAVAADADADTFQLEALGGTALDLSLTAERPCTVQLRDPWGETALEETGDAVTLAETLAAGGLWTVRVLPGGAAGAYTLELSGTLPDGDASVAGTLSSGQDADDYAVDALRGSLLQVEVRSADFQPDLQVLDPCGNALELDGYKSMEAGRVVLSGYVLPDSGEPYESGAYTVRVISAGGSGGAYEVVYATRAPAAEELKIQDARLLGTSPSESVQAGAQLQLKVVGAGQSASDSVVILGGRELAPEGASLTTGSGSLYVTVPADLSGEQAISFRSGGEQSNVLTIQVAP